MAEKEKLEQEFQAKIIAFLLKLKIFAFKVVNATTSGHTDITCCVNGIFIGIEVKRTRGTVSALQEYTHKRLFRAGGLALIVRPDDFDSFKQLMVMIKLKGKTNIHSILDDIKKEGEKGGQ